MENFTINLFKKLYDIITDIIAIIIALYIGLAPITISLTAIIFGGYITSIF